MAYLPLSRSVSILEKQATGTDPEFDTPTYEWVTVAVDEPFELQQTSGNEVTSGDRDTSIDQWTGFCRWDAPITSTSRIGDENGGLYHVVGTPNQIWDPWAQEWHHMELRLQTETDG